MMNRLIPQLKTALTNVVKYNFYIPPTHSETHHHVALAPFSQD
jgi:hypothetical protein